MRTAAAPSVNDNTSNIGKRLNDFETLLFETESLRFVASEEAGEDLEERVSATVFSASIMSSSESRSSIFEGRRNVATT
jgi:hypothetical protein